MLVASAEGTGDLAWVHMPGIAVGDFWKYRLTGLDVGDVRNEVMTVEDRGKPDGTTAQTYRVHSASTVTREEVGGIETKRTIAADRWVRTSDLALVALEGTLKREGVTTDEVQESFEPPLVETVYPFTSGYQWRTTSAWTHERGNATDDVEVWVTVEAWEEVEVPAGTFGAWRLNRTIYHAFGGFLLEWLSPEACDIVKEERYDRDGELAETMELAAWRCSHAEVADPTYDPSQVTLFSAGAAEPDTQTTPQPSPSPEAAKPKVPGDPLLWPALLAVMAAGAVLVAFGRWHRAK